MTKADNPSSSRSTHSQAASVLVSVIIPAYNASTYIVRTLDSVFAQTFQDFEVVVVNDGSPDTELLERALQPYVSRIRYFKQENKGPGGARNSGILQMRGKYAAFLDADDLWMPTHLSSQIAMLQADPSLDLVYADSVLTRDGHTVGHAFGREPQSSPVTFEWILTEDCTVGTSSTVASRESLIAAGLFDERFRCCEDFDLWLRMSFRGAKMNYDTATHLYHALSGESLSGDRYVMKRARIEVYEKTASTLPVSEQQRRLIRRLIDKTEGECEIDLVKKFLHEGEYEKALEAAKRATSVKANWKMRLTLFGLSRTPKLFRRSHGAYEQFLSYRSKRQSARSARKLKLSPGGAP
jgi:GT2 family glycosyltransferase